MLKEKKLFNFIGNRKYFMTITFILIAAGIITNIILGTKLNIEFKGGTVFTYSYTGELTDTQVSEVASNALEQDVSVNFSSDVTGKEKQFTVTLTKTLETEFIYSYTGEVSQEAIKTTAASTLGTDVDVVTGDNKITITPVNKDEKITESAMSSLTSAIKTLLPDNSITLVYSNSVTDLGTMLSDALSKEFGTKLSYTYTGDVDTDTVASSAGSILGFTVNAEVSTADGVNYLTITPADASKDITSENADLITAKLQETNSEITYSSLNSNVITLATSNSVKATVGKGFFIKSLFTVILGAIFVTIYVGLRFKKIGGLSAGAFATFALLHDILFAYFVYVVFRIPLDQNFIAVELTILGYSLNDTIVIYDRIRENERLFGRTKSLAEIANISINQTLKRNIITALATFCAIATVCVISLLSGLKDIISFAFPMSIGVIVGSYSTLLLAGPMWVLWREYKINKTAKKQ